MIVDDLINELYQIYSKKPNRLKHVLGVRDTALKLGKIHNVDLDKLEVAALLHDITKYYSKEKNIDLIKKHFADAEEIINEYNEHILHAYSAYIVAKEVYGVTDEDILNPIKYHTIGRSKMSIYEKIIFISDYVEPNRTYESCIKVRNITFDNIDLAVYTAIDDSIKFYEENGGQIPKSAYTAREYYKQLLEEKNEKN